jgi:hypothetical protein
MIPYRHLMLGMAMTLVAGAGQAQTQASRPFDQPGPTGDNRAATGHPAVQLAPTESAKDHAATKTPQHARQAGDGQGKSARPAHAPSYNTPGTPAENDSQ